MSQSEAAWLFPTFALLHVGDPRGAEPDCVEAIPRMGHKATFLAVFLQ